MKMIVDDNDGDSDVGHNFDSCDDDDSDMMMILNFSGEW